ncbi:MAG TPA: 2-oxoacid:acceptor oxidoreductase family protein [bacterium]|nr:2-oxoacid:acceptor oxidoreductase family protein [bacterium]
MNYPVKIKIIGAGGHGIKLLSTIFVKVMSDLGREASLSLEYDSAVRGGNTAADIVISDKKILNPVIETPHLLISTANNNFQTDTVPTVWIDDGVTSSSENAKAYPFYATARDELQNVRVGNMIILGALLKYFDVKLEQVDFSHYIRKYLELNLRALNIGYGFDV